jgi:hypothetical protein
MNDTFFFAWRRLVMPRDSYMNECVDVTDINKGTCINVGKIGELIFILQHLTEFLYD